MTRFKTFVAPAAVLVAACSIAVRADEKSAVEIADRAIQAAGGPKALASVRVITWKEKGKAHALGKEVAYTATQTFAWPDRRRTEVDKAYVIVVNGDDAWLRTSNQTRGIGGEMLAMIKDDFFVQWIVTVLPLKDPRFELTDLGETWVNERPVVGLKVACDDRPAVSLYFDKKSGLLVKSAVRLKVVEKQYMPVDQEATYSEHRESSGVMVPMKLSITRDGQRYIDLERSALKIVEEPPEEDTFEAPTAKPEK